MADNKETKQNIQAEDKAASGADDKVVSKLPKLLTGITIAVVVIVALVLCYIYFVRKPGIEKSQREAANAYVEVLDKQSPDSIIAVEAAKAAKAGYDEGNNMHLVSAISYYNIGKYAECIAQLDEFDPKDAIIGAAALSLKGDAYVNTDKLDDAAKSFKAAVKQSDNNPQYTPIFMLKLARVYRAQNNSAEELSVLKDIKSNYPVFAERNSVEAYIARLEGLK